MDWRDDPLWRELAAMRIEPEGAALTFTARLARENGWSRAHARKVMEEYRCFLYLAARVGPVTPSEDVDQAWHLHLSYTRHYWDDLCGRMVRRPLHHQPTEGGAAEGARHRGQYAATLEAYKRVFGAGPPPAIWPDVEARFAARVVRVDRSRYWLVPKAGARTAALAGASLLVAACTALAGNAASEGESGDWIPLIAIVFAFVLIVLAVRARRRGRRRDSGCSSSGCSSCSSDSSDSGGDSGCSSGCGGGGD